MKTQLTPDARPFRQERYAASPALEPGLNSLLVKIRCATLHDPRDVEIAWFIQYQSMRQGGLQKFAGDLLAAFPERLGTPAMLKIGKKDGAVYNADEVKAVRDNFGGFPLRGENASDDLALSYFLPARFLDESEEEKADRLAQIKTEKAKREKKRIEARGKYPLSYPVADFSERCRAAFLESVPETLTKFCLDPAFAPDQLEAIDGTDHYTTISGPIFLSLREALLEYMDRWEREHMAKIAETSVGKTVLDAMEYAEAERTMVLISGIYGTGKTFPSKTWCDARPGKRRFVQCPYSNDALDFFRTMAEPLGVSNSLTRSASQIRARVSEVLQTGHLSLVIDEAQGLFGSRISRNVLPGRIQWVINALANYHVPLVLVTTPQFMASRVAVEKNSSWAGGQLDGRISLYINLPEELEDSDLRAVARMHLPDGDDKSIEALVLYAMASKRRLRGIEHGVKAARHVARRAGREHVTFADIKQAIQANVIPSDSALNAALSTAARPAAGRKQHAGKVYAMPLQNPVKPASAPLPERDSGAALVVRPGRTERPSASLSTPS